MPYRNPQTEHALVYGITPTAIQLFLPKFGMRVKVFLYDRQGRVKAPLDQHSAEKGLQQDTLPEAYVCDSGWWHQEYYAWNRFLHYRSHSGRGGNLAKTELCYGTSPRFWHELSRLSSRASAVLYSASSNCSHLELYTLAPSMTLLPPHHTIMHDDDREQNKRFFLSQHILISC